MNLDIVASMNEIGKLLRYYQIRIGAKKLSNKATVPYKIGGDIAILASGPSINLFLGRREEFKDYSILCMNCFPAISKEDFFDLQPSYISLCDAELWNYSMDDTREGMEQIRSLQRILDNEVTWPLTVIAPVTEKFHFSNKNVSIIHMNINEFFGDSERIKMGYKTNQAIPGIDNVGMFSIYFAITFGFENIVLFGYDNNIFPTLQYCKDDLFQYYTEHYFLTNRDYIRAGDLGKWFTATGAALEKHFRLDEYARRVGTHIRNDSVQSLFAIYNRKV